MVVRVSFVIIEREREREGQRVLSGDNRIETRICVRHGGTERGKRSNWQGR